LSGVAVVARKKEDDMNTRKSCWSFTLIELLAVIVIIGIMAGILFKMMRVMVRSKEKSVTIAILEQVANGLNEFKAEYGQYPPSAGGIKYYYDDTNLMSSLAREDYFGKYPNAPEMLFSYGLVSYLCLREKSSLFTNTSQYVGDSSRDDIAKRRWKPLMPDLPNVTGQTETNHWAQGMNYGLHYDTFVDGWGNELKYLCNPPYQSYDLWSDGPTGSPNDDIHKNNTWDE